MADKTKTLHTAFEALMQKYSSQRDYFRSRVGTWDCRGYRKQYRRGMELLGYLDEMSNGLAYLDMSELEARLHCKQAKKYYKELYNMTKPVWRQWLEAIGITLIAMIVLRNFVFGLYHVPTGSAEPTLLVGDRVWGNNMAYLFGNRPKQGDLVMFFNPDFTYSSNAIQRFWQRYVGFGIPFLGLPSGPSNVVKRVIGKPGDVIEGRVEEGKPVVYRNGERLPMLYRNPHPLIAIKREVGFIPWKRIGPIAVPDFIRKHTKPVFYTYVSNLPYAQQPFYHMSEQSVYHPVDNYSADLRASLTEDEIAHLKEDYSNIYYIQTMRSGTGRVESDPESNKKRILKYAQDPEIDPMTGRCVDVFGPIKLMPGQYWVMGDSPRNSWDSRFWGPLYGFNDKPRKTFGERLELNNIYGRASFIIYSIDSEEAFWLFELIKHPIDFWFKSVRWNRFFKGMSADNQA